MKNNRLEQYFPNITEEQLSLIEQMDKLYREWNDKINVISRKDIDELFERHILHSLAISKIVDLKPNSQVLDVGTGGGFPGIPLAIMHPNISFTLVDSVGKKITVVEEVVKSLGLKNVKAFHDRAENLKFQYDYVVTRAVMRLKPMTILIDRQLKASGQLISLKGGDLQEELNETRWKNKVHALADYFQEDFFETKKLITSYRS